MVESSDEIDLAAWFALAFPQREDGRLWLGQVRRLVAPERMVTGDGQFTQPSYLISVL